MKEFLKIRHTGMFPQVRNWSNIGVILTGWTKVFSPTQDPGVLGNLEIFK